MFLRSSQVSYLDEILKGFEVALRSYVSQMVLSEIGTLEKLKQTILPVKEAFTSVKTPIQPMLVQKYSSKASNIIKDIDSLFDKVSFTNDCFKKQSHVSDEDVMYLSQIIDIIFLLYNPIFKDYGKIFGSPEEFDDYLSLYLKLRNSSSHPASRRVSIVDTRRVLQFIIGSISFMPIEYFWYVNSSYLSARTTEFLSQINTNTDVKHNLNSISKKHEKLILRKTELEQIKTFLLGSEDFRRVSGCVVLHGYGGVGKTALAIEFCYDLLQKSQETTKVYDYILWISSKEEELIYDREGSVKIRQFSPQYQSHMELLSVIGQLCGLEDFSEEEILNFLDNSKVLIILDNYETIKGEERKKIERFIGMCPRNIQFLLTSREFEEVADKNLEIKGFREIEIGTEFIEDYCYLNAYVHKFTKQQLESFLKHSCGNTLVITLMLDRIMEGMMDIDSSIQALIPLSYQDIEVVADFMYKNMFDSIMNSYEKEYPNLRDILNTLLIYKETIDFHSLRELTGVPPQDLEGMLSQFVKKYIIDRVNGQYELNEMATKFVKLKLIPDDEKAKKLIDKVQTYKRSLQEDLKKLYEDRARYEQIAPILDDWNAIGISETIAMAQAYRLFGETKRKLELPRSGITIKEVEAEFKKIELRSYHPYIKFQKARTLKFFLLSMREESDARQHLRNEIISSYERAYIDVNTRYTHLMGTNSYPAFLLNYSIFLLMDIRNYTDALKLLEIARDRYDSFGDDDSNKLLCNLYLAQSCCSAFLETNDVTYLIKAVSATDTCLRCLTEQGSIKNQKIRQEAEFLNFFARNMQDKLKRPHKRIFIEEKFLRQPYYFRPMLTKLKK